MQAKLRGFPLGHISPGSGFQSMIRSPLCAEAGRPDTSLIELRHILYLVDRCQPCRLRPGTKKTPPCMWLPWSVASCLLSAPDELGSRKGSWEAIAHRYLDGRSESQYARSESSNLRAFLEDTMYMSAYHSDFWLLVGSTPLQVNLDMPRWSLLNQCHPPL